MHSLEIIGLYLLFSAGVICIARGIHLKMKVRRQAKAVVRLAEKFCHYAARDWHT